MFGLEKAGEKFYFSGEITYLLIEDDYIVFMLDDKIILNEFYVDPDEIDEMFRKSCRLLERIPESTSLSRVIELLSNFIERELEKNAIKKLSF
jgi:hypothetical protein